VDTHSVCSGSSAGVNASNPNSRSSTKPLATVPHPVGVLIHVVVGPPAPEVGILYGQIAHKFSQRVTQRLQHRLEETQRLVRQTGAERWSDTALAQGSVGRKCSPE
jgi:hypothetical protein